MKFLHFFNGAVCVAREVHKVETTIKLHSPPVSPHQVERLTVYLLSQNSQVSSYLFAGLGELQSLNGQLRLVTCFCVSKDNGEVIPGLA
jgi:hypothetical protein